MTSEPMVRTRSGRRVLIGMFDIVRSMVESGHQITVVDDRVEIVAPAPAHEHEPFFVAYAAAHGLQLEPHCCAGCDLVIDQPTDVAAILDHLAGA